jgi:hypothetical protein
MWRIALISGELLISGCFFCIGLLAIFMSRTIPHEEYSVPGTGFSRLCWEPSCHVSLDLSINTLLRRTITFQLRNGSQGERLY